MTDQVVEKPFDPNEPRKRDAGDDPVYFKALEPYANLPLRAFPVIEIFGPTIQGEGSMAGTKTSFVRFGGCDYKCKMCDSLHAVIPMAVKKHSTLMSAEQILEALYKIKVDTGCEWVTLSGGNPAMWDLSLLVQLLHGVGIKIAVETQGSLWRDWLGEVDMLTISPKGPGMGERFNQEEFTKFLGHLNIEQQVCFKIVVFDQRDLEFAVGVDQLLYRLTPISHQDKYPCYLSLGNPYPPKLTETLDMDAGYPPYEPEYDPTKVHKELAEELLDRFRNLLEMDYLPDPRLAHWKFLPQLHVLVWANKVGV